MKGLTNDKAKEEAMKWITRLQMSDVKKTKAAELSGGEKRKLLLGIALSGNPEVRLGHFGRIDYLNF